MGVTIHLLNNISQMADKCRNCEIHMQRADHYKNVYKHTLQKFVLSLNDRIVNNNRDQAVLREVADKNDRFNNFQKLQELERVFTTAVDVHEVDDNGRGES